MPIFMYHLIKKKEIMREGKTKMLLKYSQHFKKLDSLYFFFSIMMNITVLHSEYLVRHLLFLVQHCSDVSMSWPVLKTFVLLEQ